MLPENPKRAKWPKVKWLFSVRRLLTLARSFNMLLPAAVINFWIKIHPSSEKWVAKDSLNRCQPQRNRTNTTKSKKKKQQKQQTKHNASCKDRAKLEGKKNKHNASSVKGDGIASSPVLVWQKANKATQSTTSHDHHTQVCKGRTNTALCGNQGPSQEPREQT